MAVVAQRHDMHRRQQYSPSKVQERKAATAAEGFSTYTRLKHYTFRLDSIFALAPSFERMLKHSMPRRLGISVQLTLCLLQWECSVTIGISICG